ELFLLHTNIFNRVSVSKRFFEIESKEGFLDLEDPVDQLFARLRSNFLQLGFHRAPPSWSWRVMNFVLMGSFAAASCMARCAVARSTPSISKRIRPGFTTATQPSGAPLPLPIRVSAGFFVIGLSGKTRIHSLSPRLT